LLSWRRLYGTEKQEPLNNKKPRRRKAPFLMAACIYGHGMAFQYPAGLDLDR
jgi:hypothetical protein